MTESFFCELELNCLELEDLVLPEEDMADEAMSVN